MAALKLCQFETNAQPAVPALVRLACSAPSNTISGSGPWYVAGMTLCVVDPQTAGKVLTNGYWTYEKYANQLGLSKASDDAVTNGTPAKPDPRTDPRRRRLEQVPNNK